MSEAREDRFCALYEWTLPQILAYALRRTATREDATDVVAETYEVAWRRLDDVPTGQAALLWLYVTARHVLANHGRRVRRRDEVTVRLAEELRGAELREEAPDAEGVVMQLCLNALAPDERELLMLAGWEGLSAAQMGRVLGCSPTAARIRLHRARARLKSEMAEFEASEKLPAPVEHRQDRSTAMSPAPEEVLEQ
jgi:RNA polymerase sigma factor (sigma-70 family)